MAVRQGAAVKLTRYNDPFPHVVIDDYLSMETVRAINAEWPDIGWLKEDGRVTRKWSTNDLTPTARAAADDIETWLIEEAIGRAGIVPYRETALHSIPPGGFLGMHYDYNVEKALGLRRRANALIYLNEGWQEEWKGHLQLGLDRPKLIAPVAGRCVIFETNNRSWHGHPVPLACPPDRQRRSLAVYFFTDDAGDEVRHTTVYHTKARAA